MRTLLNLFLGGLFLFCLATRLPAQGTNDSPESLLLRDVKQLVDVVLRTVNQGDVAATLKFFETNCLVTWSNAELSRGHNDIRAFAERMTGGSIKQLEMFNCELKVDDSPRLLANGTVAICSGAFNQHYKLAGGRVTDLQGRWSAALTKQDGHWLVANLQLSTNPFDNSLLRLAKQAGWVVGVVSLLIGGAVGWMIGRQRHAPTSAA